MEFMERTQPAEPDMGSRSVEVRMQQRDRQEPAREARA